MKITVTREPDFHVENQEQFGWVDAQSYASLTDDALIRVVPVGEYFKLGCEKQVLRSEDNGETWEKTGVVARREAVGDGRIIDPGVPAAFLDPDNGLLVLFTRDFFDIDRQGEYGELDGDSEGTNIGPGTARLYYQISRDGGRTWDARQQVIESGPEFDSEHWAKNIWYGKSTCYIEGRRFHKLPDGTMVVPAYLWPTNAYIAKAYEDLGCPEELRDDFKYYMESFCLFARWREDLSGLNWESGDPMRVPVGYTAAGTTGSDEPTIAYLDDGRWMCVVRTATSHVEEFRKRNIPAIRQFSVSTDQGRSWEMGQSLTFDDGSPVYSPSAYSDFVRSIKTGKWYWIGNILAKPSFGNCDPRYPLQIAELDPNTLCLKKDTVTIIEDKAPDDTDWVRFSNFRVYEERGTKDIILLMMKCYCELQEDRLNMPCPAYRYRIHFC